MSVGRRRTYRSNSDGITHLDHICAGSPRNLHRTSAVAPHPVRTLPSMLRRRPLRVKMILPALTEATSPYFRPIKYALFPPLGLATLAAFLDDDIEVRIVDEHVERLQLDDEPDLVVIQAYITSARRSYEIADHYRARGVHVAMGGLHPTSLPEEAGAHADTVFTGPGEDTWPRFLADLARGQPAPRYDSRIRTLDRLPPIRRDLIKRHLYLVP